ncbi:MAG: hypothetical protein E7326_04970 [Clostridiales bacterium]|nr:hypothetical protein [Clostridiales bacterium]
MQTWRFYTTKEIKPAGWMKKQLEIQAKGLCGNLDKVWPDVRDSAWIGGNAEGWERVPYWLDGFIPMAYLLEDEDLIARAKKYIDAILSRQCEDGWICPCTEEERAGYDKWVVHLISKVLVVYYECSGDERIPDVVYRVMKNYHKLLSEGAFVLHDWGKYRWYEAFIALNFLYERCREDWICDLAKIIRDQGTNFYDNVPLWHTPLNRWRWETHIVNIAMMLKFEAVSHELLGEEYRDQAEYFVDFLTRHHGMPAGTFTGDECLGGLSPIRGTELCSVVEQMYAYEHLYAVTGDKKWAERLEVLAFNALPAANSDDMWGHQYDQITNQISCERFYGRPIFGTNADDSHRFGLEPNFGCCTANFGQGWPKLMLSAFMHQGDTVVNAVPVPGVLDTGDIRIELETDYPFKNCFTYRICADKPFTFKVRIPSFAMALQVDGKDAEKQDELTFAIGPGEREINIRYHVRPYLDERPYDLRCVRMGSLLFALPFEYKMVMREYTLNGVERKFPYCDYDYVGSKKDWNMGLYATRFEKQEMDVDDVPFSSHNPPVILKTDGALVEWELLDGYDSVCDKLPKGRKAISEKREITLWPYGCAKVRMTEMPLIEE